MKTRLSPADIAKLHFSDEEDDTGTDTGTGSTDPIIDPILFGIENFSLTENIREGEKKFGHVPRTEDYTKKKTAEQNEGNRIKAHPLFRDTQQFSGISDNKNNPNPKENSEAEKQYERLENRPVPALAHKHQHRSTPTPRPL